MASVVIKRPRRRRKIRGSNPSSTIMLINAVRFLADLRNTVRRLCQFEPPQTTSAVGAFHRAWINLRIAISRDDRAILAECERGEDSAMHE